MKAEPHRKEEEEPSTSPLPGVGSSAVLGGRDDGKHDWQRIQATMFWYRFGKLTNPNNRTSSQIPIGWGWIFETYRFYLEDIKLPPEHNPTGYPTVIVQKRIEFWKRWFDPVILVPASIFVRVLEAGLRVFSTPDPDPRNEDVRPPETTERSDHLLEVRSPVTGLTEWSNRGAIDRLFYCEVSPSDTLGVLQGVSYGNGAVPTNDSKLSHRSSNPDETTKETP